MSENHSQAVVNSTASKTPEKKAKLAAYMREYRKRRKLASGAVIAIENSAADGARGEAMNTYACPEEGSSPVAPPGAAPVVHLGPHGYPAD